MNRTWIMVIFASLFEVLWVIGLKHADSILEWSGTVICIIISFYSLIMAGRTLPVGTVYAVFVGLGTAGTVLSEILFFHVPFSTMKLALILVLLVGVIGLKFVTNEKSTEGGNL